jgi:hypothetical protein
MGELSESLVEQMNVAPEKHPWNSGSPGPYFCSDDHL